MKVRRMPVIIAISLLIMLLCSSTNLATHASQLENPPQPPVIEQAERPIYEPLYFETHILPGTLPNATLMDAPLFYTAMAIQNLDYYGGKKYHYEIYYYDEYGNTNITNTETDDEYYPKLNPGSSQVVFTSDRTGNLELVTMWKDGSNRQQVTWDSESDVRPDWSPDSSWMVWESYRDGQAEIYIQTYNAEYLTRLTQDAGFDGMPAWSPDGSKIAFISNRTGGYLVYTMNTDGSELVQLSDQPYSVYPVWSPDGAQIAFSADSDGDGWLELWMMDADGSNEVLLYDTTVQYADVIANSWSPNDYFIAFTMVEYDYYDGDWYWKRANIYGWNYSNGSIYDFYTTNIAWYADWQTTETGKPVSAVTAPTLDLQPYRFQVEWAGYDDVSGVYWYEIQVRDGASGPWVDWAGVYYYEDPFEWFEGSGGHTYYFRSRARDKAGNMEDWPVDYDLSVRVESSPPTTTILPLPRYTSQDFVQVKGDGYDPGDSGIATMGIDQWDDISLTWTAWITSGGELGEQFYGTPGHTYKFRSWASDLAGNLEKPPSLGDALTTFYAWMAGGQVTDNTGTPVEGAELSTSAEPFVSQSSDAQGKYWAYFALDLDEKSVVMEKSGYAALLASQFDRRSDVQANFVMPPADNIVRNWGFEESEPLLDWDTGGIYTPTLSSSSAHSGEQAAVLGRESGFSEPVALGIEPQWGNMLATVVAPDHTFHVAEISYIDGYVIVYRQLLSDNTWLPLEVVDVPTFIVDYINIVIDSHNIVHMLWQEVNAGTKYATRSLDGTWSEPALLYPGNSAPEDVIIDENDTLHVLLYWEDMSYVQKPEGGEWSEPETIPTPWDAFTKMAVTPEGEAHFIGGADYLYYNKRSMDGSWSETQQISTRRPHSFALAVDSQGTPHAVWDEGQDAYGENVDIVYATPQADGSWPTPTKIASEVIGKQNLALGIDRQDTLHLVWDGSYTDREWPYEIYYQQKARAGSWTEPVNVSSTESHSSYPSLALVGNGDILTAWLENGNTPYYAWVFDGVPASPIRLAYPQGNYFPPQTAYDGKGSIHLLWAEGDEISPEYFHMGNVYASEAGSSWISQSLTLPISMTQPYLSFLYTENGLSGSASGAEVLLSNAGVSTTLLTFDESASGWQHALSDLFGWSGEAVTITFRLNQALGEPLASLKLDEVTIGQAHPDTWVTVDGDVSGLQGDQISLLLEYGNRGVVLAENSMLTITLPAGLSFVSADPAPSLVDGDQVVWELGDLPAGDIAGQIALTLEVDGTGEAGNWVTTQVALSSQTDELEMLNNLVEFKTFVGSLVVLPFTAK